MTNSPQKGKTPLGAKVMQRQQYIESAACFARPIGPNKNSPQMSQISADNQRVRNLPLGFISIS
jgi:hypothetical protein